MSDAVCANCSKVNLHALKAAHTGHLACLRAAFADNANKSCAGDSKGATALHLAARAGHGDCLEWLLKNSGMDAKCKAKNGETSTHLAASQGKLECIKLLYAHDPSTITTKDRYGQIALHLATLREKLECVEWLLEDGKNSPKARNQTGATPIHFAAALNDINCAKALIRVAGNKAVNVRDDNGTTPIYFAAQEGHLEMVKYLVATCKGDALARSSDGMTSIHAATQGGHLETLQWLVKKLGESLVTDAAADGGTPIHFAAAMGQYECLKWLLSTKRGKKAVQKTDSDGGTPAHDAADNGQKNCLALLVANGADLHIKDKDGYTPYELAVQGKHDEISEYVIQLTGGDVSRNQLSPKGGEHDHDNTQFDAWNEAVGQRDTSKPIMTPIYSMSSLISDRSLQRRPDDSTPQSPVESTTSEIMFRPKDPALARLVEQSNSRRVSETPSLVDGPSPPTQEDLDLIDPVIPSTPKFARAHLVQTPKQSSMRARVVRTPQQSPRSTPRTIAKRLTRELDDDDPGYAKLDYLQKNEVGKESESEPNLPLVDSNDVYATVNKPSLRQKQSKETEANHTVDNRRSSVLADALKVASETALLESPSKAENRPTDLSVETNVLNGEEPPEAPPVPRELSFGKTAHSPAVPLSQLDEQSDPPAPPPVPIHLGGQQLEVGVVPVEDQLETGVVPVAPPAPKSLDWPANYKETPVERQYRHKQPQQPLPFQPSPKLHSLQSGVNPMDPLMAMREQRKAKQQQQIEQSIKRRVSNEQTRGANSELKRKLIERQHQFNDNKPVEINGQHTT